MTSPNKPDFELHDFEDLLKRFLAGEQLSPQEKEQLGKHVEQLKQQQVTKHNLLDIFGKAPEHEELMKRIEAHFVQVPQKIQEIKNDITKIADLPLMTDLHAYLKIWSLKDPSSTPSKAPNSTKPTPSKQPIAPKLTNKKTPEEILKSRAEETKEQWIAREQVIIGALNAVMFPGKYVEEIKQGVVLILQSKNVLPTPVSDKQEKRVMDFLRAPKTKHPFRKQPRFKSWMGQYIDRKYL